MRPPPREEGRIIIIEFIYMRHTVVTPETLAAGRKAMSSDDGCLLSAGEGSSKGLCPSQNICYFKQKFYVLCTAGRILTWPIIIGNGKLQRYFINENVQCDLW